MNFDRLWAKIKIKGEKIKKTPVLIIKHAGFVFILLLLISFLIGSLLFYKYGYLAINKKIKSENQGVSFSKNLYSKIINKWEDQEELLNKVEGKRYLNPFKANKVTEEPTNTFREEPQLTSEEKEKLLSNPDVQSLLKADNLFEFYITKEDDFLTIEERAKIWEKLNLGKKEEYAGGYYQNIKLLRELKKELTK